MVSPFFDTDVLCLAGESLRSEAHAIRRVLLELPSKAPGLQDLRIEVRGLHDPSLVMNIGRFHELRKLALATVLLEEPWFGPFMSMLANLQHLRDLDLPLGRWAGDAPSMAGCFPQLRRLRLRGQVLGQDMLSLGPLAKRMPPIRLECLEVADVNVKSFTGDYCAFEDLATACADTLTTVTLSLGDTIGGLDPPSASNLLRPLVQLRHLQFCVLSLSGYESMSFTDDDLRGIRGAWPLLKMFSFYWPLWPFRAGTIPTFRGVVDFLLCECPHMTVLRLAAIDIDSETMDGSPPEPCSSLRALPSGLAVEDERIRDPVAFARILRALFPLVRVSEGAVESASGKWGIVLSRLRYTNEVR